MEDFKIVQKWIHNADAYNFSLKISKIYLSRADTENCAFIYGVAINFSTGYFNLKKRTAPISYF